MLFCLICMLCIVENVDVTARVLVSDMNLNRQIELSRQDPGKQPRSAACDDDER